MLVSEIRIRRPWRALAAGLVLVLASGCDPRPKPPGDGLLRILSWNSFNLPTIAGEMGQVNLDEEERGRLVARLLKQSGYDVVALNEVFDETVRKALMEEAQSGPDGFRFVVRDIDGGGKEDSGLALLSRLEPIRFTAPEPIAGQHIRGFLDAGGQPLDIHGCADMELWLDGTEVDAWVSGAADNCLIVFRRYRHCTDTTPDGEPAGAECDAGKGVAYVRLRQRNGEPLDLYWSHTQASLSAPEYETPLPDFLTARDGQLAELQAMVQHWSPAPERDAIILGDLNIDGFGKVGGFPDEYRKQLAQGPESRLGALGFRDLWPQSAPQEDLGPTYSPRNDHVPSDRPQERLDYVLWRDRKGAERCDQHPRVERGFDVLAADGSRTDLSDHFGVGAELRRPGEPIGGVPEPCTPMSATPLAPLMPSGILSGRLNSPGACQWLRVEQGTWTLTNISDQPLRIGAFAARDISEPLALFRGDARLEVATDHAGGDEAQIATEEPFLLKICWEDGQRTGDYRLRVAQNVGADPQHPVVLALNRDHRLAFGSQFGANPSTLIWALVQLPATFSGEGHALRLDLGDHAPTPLRPGSAPVVAGNPSPPITWGGPMAPAEGLLDLGRLGGGSPEETFVVIEREPPANPAAQLTFTARVLTDHHEVRLGVLECREQEDATGDDRIRLTYSADGASRDLIDLGAFDEGQDKDLSGHGQLGRNWVRGQVTISIYDQDGEDLEDDPTSGSALDHLGTIRIPDFGGDPGVAPDIATGTGIFALDEASYWLEFERRR